jgi:hypothetical protein
MRVLAMDTMPDGMLRRAAVGGENMKVLISVTE